MSPDYANAGLVYHAKYLKVDASAGTRYTELVAGGSNGRLPVKPVVQVTGTGIVVTYNPYVADMVGKSTYQTPKNPIVNSVFHVSATCHDILPLYIRRSGDAHKFSGSQTISGNYGMHNEENGTVKSTWNLYYETP